MWSQIWDECEVTVALTSDHQKSPIESLCQLKRKKIPYGVLEISHPQEWDGWTEGHRENILYFLQWQRDIKVQGEEVLEKQS